MVQRFGALSDVRLGLDGSLSVLIYGMEGLVIFFHELGMDRLHLQMKLLIAMSQIEIGCR